MQTPSYAVTPAIGSPTHALTPSLTVPLPPVEPLADTGDVRRVLPWNLKPGH